MRSPSLLGIRGFSARLLGCLVTIIGAVTLIFFLARITGDPAQLMAPPGATTKQVDDIRVALGLDRPVFDQYLSFLGGASRGDLGESYAFQQDVTPMVLDRLGATVQLAFTALVVALVVGTVTGLLAAFKRSKAVDRALVVATMLGQAIPSFWLAPTLVLVFAVNLALFPVAGKSGASSFVLPVAALALFQIAVIFRITRATALEVLSQDYIKLARSKGVGPVRLALAHVSPNTLLPVMTIVGLSLANLIGGSVIVEVIFSWPGLGNLMISAVGVRDFPLIQGIALVFAVGYVAINFIVDSLYKVADPRLRVQS